MNILFYRYNSICEPDIIAIMQRLGHTVTEITEEMRNKELDARGQMNLVSAELKKQESQIVFSINFFRWFLKSAIFFTFHMYAGLWTVR